MVEDAPSPRPAPDQPRATAPPPAVTGGGPCKLVCFFLHGQEYAAPIAEIKETMLVRPITRVFLTPAWLAGIINLRGDIVAVIDLARLLGLRPTAITDSSRIVIATHRGKIAGILVDRMAELRNLDLDRLQTPPPMLAGDGAALLRGIATVDGGAPVRVLDLSNLFESDRLQAFRRT
jgi:purine-binding chemotaxis protein CheW